jgi:hypothetical protein
MKHEDAKWLLGEYLTVAEELHRICREMRTRLPEAETSPHLAEVGIVLSRLLNPVERVLKEHPDLRPPGLDK